MSRETGRRAAVTTFNRRMVAVAVAVAVAGCSSDVPSEQATDPGVGAGADSVVDAPLTVATGTVDLPTSTAPAAVSSIGTSSTATPPTTAPFGPASSTSTVPMSAIECVAHLPLEWRAGQVLMPAVYGDRLADAAPVVDQVALGGVILMTWPAGSDPAALASLKSRSTVPLLVATDEEGGNVQRLRALGALPSEADVAASMTPQEAERMIADHAAAVRSLGVDMVFGPVVDVGSAAPIGDRSFGDDPAVVAEFGAAYVRGWLSAGVTPVLKHFPGHGRASADSHTSASATPPLDELRSVDLVPYRSFAGDARVGVMVGHLDVPGLTDAEGVPASLSSAAISGLLRGELGFRDSLVVTDALGMTAVAGRFGLAEAALRALTAGVDIVLFTSPSDAPAVRDAIVAAVLDGRLPAARLDEAVGLLLERKSVDPCTLDEVLVGSAGDG